ncbi:MAG TPA: galactokinase [Saprospiraceae bacterium]|nr:galactokinase [Saprospiraceae bacterium]
MIDQLKKKWHHHFGSASPEVIVRAPGRVNIIGEHTDYNEGWVLPGAMSRSVYVLVSRSKKGIHHWVADNMNEEYVSGNEAIMPLWGKYIDGTIQLYDPKIGSLNILIGGDLPVGAGVSSSSSLVCGILYALQKITGGKETKDDLALKGSRVEREIIGLLGGIMDQFAIMLSKADQVMMLDCRTKEYKFISAELPGCKWVLINTKVKHKLIDSDYNNRADECLRAVSIIQRLYPAVKSLRDVTPDMLSEIHLPELIRKRSVYILEENDRVHKMVEALKKNNATKAGALLKASHAGLRDLYEVSCAELDHLAAVGNKHKGAYGARMMGGGFGGCVICLVKEEAMEDFLEECSVSYFEKFGFDPEVIEFDLGNGVELQ